MKLNDNVYSILKWLVVLVLPAAATLYNVIANIWHLPLADEISKTILAISTFVGAIIGISTAEYERSKQDG